MGLSFIGFLQPWFLLSLLGIPIIILLYMLRPKNKPTVISSTFLWESVLRELESASKIQKLRSSILMFLQILALILMVLLLAGFYYLSEVKTEHTIIVIDNTITMQAEDVSPNRISKAKEQAKDYIENLPDEQRITLIEMRDVPLIHVNQTKNKQVAMNMVEAIKASALNGDYIVLEDIISAILGESGGEVVYFGDKEIPGTTTYYIGGDSQNAGISNVSFSKYDEASISVLASLYSSEKGPIQVSLYGDDLLLDAISVEVGDSLVGKAFFNPVPNIFEVLRVVVDQADGLSLDNTAYLSIAKSEAKKVALITEGNVFLEKVFLLSQGTAVYQVAMDDHIDLKGFDLYVYDNIFPENYPESGTILLFNPTIFEDLTDLGFVSNPAYSYNNHPITSHLVENDYAIGVSHVYELPTWAEPIITTEEGVIAFSGRKGNSDVVVYGFDIHNTDLPLTASFPIMMTNLINYYLNQNQVQGNNYQIGDTVEINLSPSTLSGTITNPNGVVTTLDGNESYIKYYDTFEPGIYYLNTKTGEGDQREMFVVNASAAATKLNSFGVAHTGSKTFTTHETLRMLIGALLLGLLAIEWIIYGVRRGR